MTWTHVCGDGLARKPSPEKPLCAPHCSAEPGLTSGKGQGKAILRREWALRICPGCSVGSPLSSPSPAFLPHGGLSDCCRPHEGPVPDAHSAACLPTQLLAACLPTQLLAM